MSTETTRKPDLILRGQPPRPRVLPPVRPHDLLGTKASSIRDNGADRSMIEQSGAPRLVRMAPQQLWRQPRRTTPALPLPHQMEPAQRGHAHHHVGPVPKPHDPPRIPRTHDVLRGPRRNPPRRRHRPRTARLRLPRTLPVERPPHPAQGQQQPPRKPPCARWPATRHPPREQPPDEDQSPERRPKRSPSRSPDLNLKTVPATSPTAPSNR